MHLLIPFAACNDPASRQVLRGLRLPQLEKLVSRLSPLPRDSADDDAPSMPHERVLARTLGLPPTDPIPWAAWQASQRSLDQHQAWAFITPCHWQVGQSSVILDHPDALALPDDESRALLSAMQAYFKEDGITLVFESAGRWLAHGEVFRHLTSAAPERVIGRDVAPWLPTEPALRRLQNEMQMLLYTHPVNDARSQRGALPVNSFWISGTGALDRPVVPSAEVPSVARQLADAALAANWSSWGRAWEQLDAQEITSLLRALAQGSTEITLTLCGERQAQSWVPAPRGAWRRLAGIFQRPSVPHLLESL